VETSCTRPNVDNGETFPIPIVARDTVLPSLSADLVLYNKIDLASLGGGSCLAPKEYVVSARNFSTNTSYRVTTDSKYMCGGSAGPPCVSNGTPAGDGQNRAVQTADLGSGQCGGIEYLNDALGPALPHCCDCQNPNNCQKWAKQCASFIATR